MGRGGNNLVMTGALVLVIFLTFFIIGYALATHDPRDVIIHIFFIALLIIIVLAALNPAPKEVTRTITVEARCPHCEAMLSKMPQRKTRCPTCGNYIYVRTRQVLYPRVLLTEEEARLVDRMRQR